MKQHYYIDLVEEYSNVNFCSIHLEGEELTEFVRFFEKFPVGNEYDEDIDVVISWLDSIAERGALERYFRPEGHYGDGVGVTPIDIGNKVRSRWGEHPAGGRNTKRELTATHSFRYLHYVL